MGYELPHGQGFGDEAAMRRWTTRDRLTGDALLGLAVLVIREVLNAAGMIRECALERRLGSACGPLHGNPARVEFVGAARRVRTYRALETGRLVETAALPVWTQPSDDHELDRSHAEDAALRARFGNALIVLDSRPPTLFEDMAGLSRIAHLQLPDGRNIGCGLGWHGPVAYLLAADFPRFQQSPALLPAQDALVASTLASHALDRYELRVDEHGLGVVARQHGGSDLFIIRPDDSAPIVEPYHPGRTAVSADQDRWLRYIETYERRSVLDAYRLSALGELTVVTGDAEGQVWRHQIDGDGVESTRTPANDTAVGALYREQLALRTVQAPEVSNTEAPPALPSVAARADPPPDSVLARAQLVSDVFSALRDARFACIEAVDRGAPVPSAGVQSLRSLAPPLQRLTAHLSAASGRDLLRRCELGTVTVAAFDTALDGLESRVMDELALVQATTMAPLWRLADIEGQLGLAVRDHFPAAAYPLDEAAKCLALHRPAAAVLHAMQVIRIALGVQATVFGTPDWPASWQQAIQALAAAAGAPAALIEALDAVRRQWQSPDLMPAGKYTEAEAEAVLDAVAAFLLVLATACEERTEANTPAGPT
jgi:hypothetical protein